MFRVSKTGLVVCIVVVTLGITFVALHFLSVRLECDSRCLEVFVFAKFCGKLSTGINETTYHTFTKCEHKCHAIKHPDREFDQIGDMGSSCRMLGYPEKVYGMNEPSEYRYPYIKPEEISGVNVNKTG